ncbi:MAG TPA: N-6 DNA methylase, partial [Candidatus Aminicenantes bacterium]|nr:N-6 DNA methylase [Candidatus Aminicenantes bacterium]
FAKAQDVPKYARMVGFDEIEKNDFNLNLPRYVDSTEPEDLQDIEGHLKGGIPAADVDALSAYWAVCPKLRKALFSPLRPGYLALAPDKAGLKKTILEHPEFVALTADMGQHFAAWRKPAAARLKALKAGFHPKELVAEISEGLLRHYEGKPLIDAIVAGKIKGVVGIVGCNNPKIKQDYGHITLGKELIKRNILVVETGCAAIASGKAGLLVPEAADQAGEGLKSVCKALGIPPVLHMGSCVDNSRILVMAAHVANELGVGIDQLPLGGAAPEWYSQKAIAIGTYFVSSGVYTVLGIPPKIFGSANVTNLLAAQLTGIVNASFAVEPDPVKAADLLEAEINRKRKALGI